MCTLRMHAPAATLPWPFQAELVPKDVGGTSVAQNRPVRLAWETSRGTKEDLQVDRLEAPPTVLLR